MFTLPKQAYKFNTTLNTITEMAEVKYWVFVQDYSITTVYIHKKFVFN